MLQNDVINFLFNSSVCMCVYVYVCICMYVCIYICTYNTFIFNYRISFLLVLQIYSFSFSIFARNLL